MSILYPETSSIERHDVRRIHPRRGSMNLTPFFEVSYVEHDYFYQSGHQRPALSVRSRRTIRLIPAIRTAGAWIAAWDTTGLLTNPNFVAQWVERLGWVCAQFGIPACLHVRRASSVTLATPMGTYPRRTPVVSVEGDRNRSDAIPGAVSVTSRGLSGDIPALNVGQLSDWSFELSLTHSRSDGIGAAAGHPWGQAGSGPIGNVFDQRYALREQHR